MGEQVAARINFKVTPGPFRRHSACHDCFAILTYGGVAQLGEHLPCKQGVMSSNLTISTKAMSRAIQERHRCDVLAREQMWIYCMIGREPVMKKAEGL